MLKLAAEQSGLSPEAGVTRAHLSCMAVYVGILSGVHKYIDVALPGLSPGARPHPWRGRGSLPCPFTAWIKDCPEFKYLMFFLISHSWNDSVWRGPWPTCPIPPSPRHWARPHLRGCLGPSLARDLAVTSALGAASPGVCTVFLSGSQQGFRCGSYDQLSTHFTDAVRFAPWRGC